MVKSYREPLKFVDALTMPPAWSGPLGSSGILLSLLLLTSASPLQLPLNSTASQESLAPPERHDSIIIEENSLPVLSGTGIVNTLNKYFHEPDFSNGHYDQRYFTKEVPYDERRLALRHLIRSYLAVMRKHGIETWLAHGTLLGWWWNGAIMPWDSDLDVQVSYRSLDWMARTLNRTEHVYYHRITSHFGNALEDDRFDDDNDEVEHVETTRTSASYSSAAVSPTPSPSPETHQRRTYLLDVNPHYTELELGDGMNIIDARWIDISNGLFIDITTLRERHSDRPGLWSCKNKNYYPSRDLWPMRVSRFEDARVRIPYGFEKILTVEYGPQSLVLEEFEGHRWHSDEKQWRKMTPLEIQEREEQARHRWRDDMIRNGQAQYARQ